MLEYRQRYMGKIKILKHFCKVLKTFLSIWIFFMIRLKKMGLGGKKSSKMTIDLPEMKIYYDAS